MIKKLLPIFISVFLVNFNMLCVNASENVLRGVDVIRGTNSYKIEVTSTSPADMTKTIVSANRIIVNLKNIDISKNITTKFNGNAVIDNVMVEPCGLNNVNIMIQGDNIAYSNVEFKAPTKLETTEDTIKASFTSLYNMLSGSSKTDRTFQFGILGIFLLVLFGEIKFIKSKYDELQKEKQEMIRNINATSDFKDYLPGYGRAGIKKPYTTPVYGNSVNTTTVRPVRKPAFKMPETLTLNKILNNTSNEKTIINQILNPKPVFGTLSNISINDNVPPKTTIANKISNPLEKSRMKANIKYLEEMTNMYKNKSSLEKQEQIMRSRLNKIY